MNRGGVLTKSAGTNAELKSGDERTSHERSDDVVWFWLVHHCITSQVLIAIDMYDELSRYTHMPLVITMSLSKVRKGLEGFRYATKIVTIDISFMVFP